MKINIKVYDLEEQNNKNMPKNIIFPTQTHSNNIIEIETGNENLENCDGIFTSNNYYLLGVKVADCAAICFYDNQKYGIIHVGWRGLISGIIEKMLNAFNNPKIFVSPLLKEFEIQKDDCYEKIKNKFGEKYFLIKKEKKKKIIIFQFQKSIKDILPKNTIFDSRDTFKDNKLASRRRDKIKQNNFIVISNNLAS